MKEIEQRLREKVKTISEFKVTEKDPQDVVKKRKKHICVPEFYKLNLKTDHGSCGLNLSVDRVHNTWPK